MSPVCVLSESVFSRSSARLFPWAPLGSLGCHPLPWPEPIPYPGADSPWNGSQNPGPAQGRTSSLILPPRLCLLPPPSSPGEQSFLPAIRPTAVPLGEGGGGREGAASLHCLGWAGLWPPPALSHSDCLQPLTHTPGPGTSGVPVGRLKETGQSTLRSV